MKKNHASTPTSSPPASRWRICLLVAAGLVAALPAMQTLAQPVQNAGPNGTVDTWASGGGPDGHCIYHPQVTAYFCGAATMEMELDCSAVRNANAAIDKCLGAGVAGATPGAAAVDGAPKPVFPLQLNWTPPTYNAGIITFGFQSFLYQLVHGLSTWNGRSYSNPYYGPGLGTSLDDLAVGLNLVDSPANAAGPHNYVAYNILNPDWANRTMATALWQLGIPAAATVMHGAHWVAVIGVETDVNPVPNQAYKIYGFFVSDPWTGYQQANPLDQRGNAVPLGLGEHKFCSTRINPNRAANDELWNSLFNTASGPPLPYYGYGVGYKFEVEPIGPIDIDTGNNGQYNSIPAPSAILPNSPLTAAEALVYATNSLDGDAYLDTQPGFENGHWDVASAELVQYPSDGPNEGDWLIPYEGSGGVNDVTAFVMVDVETGDLDEAVWMNPTDSVPYMSLTNVEAMETQEFNGIVPNDNTAPPQLAIKYDGGYMRVINPGPPPITNYVFIGTNDVTLTWAGTPLTTNTFSVEENNDLALSNNWTTLNLPVSTNSSGNFLMNVPVSMQHDFFRLSYP